MSREDLFDVDPDLEVDSDSDLLLSGGLTYETPVEGLDLFAGYAENFKAISSLLLEVPGRSLDLLEPETASNIDVGLQYAGDRLALSATWYTIDFQNCIFYLGPATAPGPNYLIPGGGAHFNAGGIDTSGIEFSATVQMPRQTSFYTAFTFNDSEYIGSGDPLVDANQGIVAGTDVTGVPDRLRVVVSLDRSGPLGVGLSAKYMSLRRVSLRSDWYADAYWLVDAYVSFSGGVERSAPVDGIRDRSEQPIRQGVSVGHHRDRRVARRAADDFDDRDRLLLTASSAANAPPRRSHSFAAHGCAAYKPPSS